MKRTGKNATQNWPRKRTGDAGCISTRLRFCPWGLFSQQTRLIRNRFLHNLKGMVRYDGRNWILSIRMVFLQPVTSPAMQCSCKSLMIMCCYHWKQWKQTYFMYLNNGLPTRWHLLYYILLNMFQTLIRPSSGASEYCGSVVQPTLGYHITNRQSRYITPARLKSAYTTQQVLASSWRWTY